MALRLRDDVDGQKALAIELYDRFHAMKTYGKEPESLESITRIFIRDLVEYPVGKVLSSISTHSQRSQEFPTTYDLVSILKRNGRPPLKESDIITIRKKDGEDRNGAEWQMLREWDEQQREGWRDSPDEIKEAATQADNERLRDRVNELQCEIERLSSLLHQVKVAKGLERPTHSMQEKIDKTVQTMKSDGAPEEDIQAFLSSCGLSPHREAA